MLPTVAVEEHEAPHAVRGQRGSVLIDQLDHQFRVEAERSGEPPVLATGTNGLWGQDSRGQVVGELAERLVQ